MTQQTKPTCPTKLPNLRLDPYALLKIVLFWERDSAGIIVHLPAGVNAPRYTHPQCEYLSPRNPFCKEHLNG